MKNVGYLLLAAGFIVAAYGTALDVQNVDWTLFGIAALAAIAGVVLFKLHEQALAQSDEVLEGNRSELRESINNIVQDLHELTMQDLRGEPLRARIDDKLRPDLRRFADARESMVHLFGLQAYADIMSDFAAGERYINRVWSASADGYDGEAAAYVRKAAEQFADAQKLLGAAESR